MEEGTYITSHKGELLIQKRVASSQAGQDENSVVQGGAEVVHHHHGGGGGRVGVQGVGGVGGQGEGRGRTLGGKAAERSQGQ